MKRRRWSLIEGAGNGAGLALLLSAFAACGSTDRVLGDQTAGSGGQTPTGGTSAGGNGATSATAGSGGGGGGGSGGSGSSGSGGSGGSGAGDTAGAAGGSSLVCAPPTDSGCPADLILYDGQEADLTNQCLKPAIPLSCSDGATGLETCWVDTSSGQLFRLRSGPCMPDAKWRECTTDERAMLDAISQDCLTSCPEGSTAGTQCLQCGQAGGCAQTEYKCLPNCADDDSCADGSTCLDGTCHTASTPCF